MDLAEIKLDRPRVFHLPAWDRTGHAGRVAFFRRIVLQYGTDPRVRQTANQILQGVQQRDYQGQAARLLQWVHQNVAYYNEPGEILQDPLYTLEHRYGDCDDLAILLATLFQSIRLPWKFALSGVKDGQKQTWREGERMPNVAWSHIYLYVGWPTFHPTTWMPVEPTIQGVPLGWEVGQPRPFGVSGQQTQLPELSGLALGALGFAGADMLPMVGSAPVEDGPWYKIDKATVRMVFLTTLVGAVSTVISQIALAMWSKRK